MFPVLVPLEQESHLRFWCAGPFSLAPVHLPRLPVLTHPGLCAALAAPVEKYPRVPHHTALCHSVLFYTSSLTVYIQCKTRPGNGQAFMVLTALVFFWLTMWIHAYAQRQAVVWLLVWVAEQHKFFLTALFSEINFLWFVDNEAVDLAWWSS